MNENWKGKRIKGISTDVTYVIDDFISHGAFGDVWRAFFEGEQSGHCAVKILKSSMADKKSVNMFAEEARAQNLLNHRNILKTYDVGFDKGIKRYFMAMQLMDKDLFQIINEGNITLNQALGIFYKACNGISHAHNRGIVHRDIHPGNILVSNDLNQVVVSDFGMAKVLEGSKIFELFMESQSGEVNIDDVSQVFRERVVNSGDRIEDITTAWLGHRQYCSPEALRKGGIKSADEKSDQFSLAKIGYELFGKIGESRYQKAVSPGLSNEPTLRFDDVNGLSLTVQEVINFYDRLQPFLELDQVMSNEQIENLVSVYSKAYHDDPSKRQAYHTFFVRIADRQTDIMGNYIDNYSKGKTIVQARVDFQTIRKFCKVLEKMGIQ